jgi:two-component system sensor histidine kinase YesM
MMDKTVKREITMTRDKPNTANGSQGKRLGWKSRLLSPFQSRIRNKLLLFMLVLSILPIMTVAYMAITRTADAMEKEIVNFNESQLSTVSEYMSEKLSQLDEMLNSIIIDDKISDRMGRLGNDDITQYYRANDYITNKLSSLYYANQSVLNGVLLYVSNIGKTYSISSYEEGIKESEPLSEKMWKKVEMEYSKLYYINNDNQNSFLIMRNINRFEDRKILGNAALNVKWSIMDRMLTVLLKDDGAEVYLIDDNNNNNILYSPTADENQREWLKRYLEQTSDQSYDKIGDSYVFREHVPNAFFSIVKIMPNEIVVDNVNEIFRYSVGIGLVSIGICFALSILFSYMMTKPITNLVRYMRKQEWIKSDYVVDRNRKDEIGLLETSFQTMVNNIKGLIEFEYEATIARRTAEVKALQAQINPHFLQNTLQIISGMAIEKGMPEIHHVVKAIGGIFRYSIRNLPDVTTLGQEWSHLRNYLYIQEMRFPNKVEIDERLPSEFENVGVPLLTLQPIVENAFEHGFKSKLDNWHIKLSVERGDADVVILIADNGMGMNSQQLAGLRATLEQNGQLFHEADSLGLRNVDARIKMHFGREYGLCIQSEEGKGMEIRIRIPAVERNIGVGPI